MWQQSDLLLSNCLSQELAWQLRRMTEVQLAADATYTSVELTRWLDCYIIVVGSSLDSCVDCISKIYEDKTSHINGAKRVDDTLTSVELTVTKWLKCYIIVVCSLVKMAAVDMLLSNCCSRNVDVAI